MRMKTDDATAVHFVLWLLNRVADAYCHNYPGVNWPENGSTCKVGPVMKATPSKTQSWNGSRFAVWPRPFHHIPVTNRSQSALTYPTWLGWDSNPGPSDPHSGSLTTTLQCVKICCFVHIKKKKMIRVYTILTDAFVWEIWAVIATDHRSTSCNHKRSVANIV